ncbi:uncharacterized protein I206_106054 [Kwoniella pini CBS 10737]|uniref:Uncharacterized protein n=1 Tax=Kwoniella pini CBS 10737 TaxID=1296096 RepID=A0A1B9I0X6_9TREE|nr:uncharacterized protein I206_04877 [Kwoniella pini CBS 10737]OCF49189.1 hypothetical protein I206_04877 [Kwoniella pini CBS 10737]
MRTVCYQPGELEQPDLTEFSMVENADQIEEELPSSAEVASTSFNEGKIDNGLNDLKLENSEMSGLMGKVTA